MEKNSIEQERINKELNIISKNLKYVPNIGMNYLEYFSALIYAWYENMEYLNELIKIKSENIRYILEVLDETLENIRKKENSRKLFMNIRFQETVYRESYGIFINVIIKLSELINNLKKSNQNSKMILAEAFEYVIMKAAKDNQISIKNEEFYTPKGLVKTMVNLLDIKDKMAVYNPACGTGVFIIESAKHANIYAFGDETNVNNYNICMTNLWLHNIYNKRIKENIDEELQKADIAIANPPFVDNNKEELNINNKLDSLYYQYNILPTTSNYIKYLLMMLESIHQYGKIAIVLPHGFLFKKTETYIRRKLIDNNYIEAIIGLPEKLFYNTKIPVIVLLLNKSKKRKDILFIDASREYTRKRKNNILTVENQNKIVDTYKNYKIVPNYSNIVTKEDIEKNNYDLDIKRYVHIEEEIENINEEKIKNNIYILEKEKAEIEYEIRNVIEKLKIF